MLRQALAAMAGHDGLRWVILPGNHDSLLADELWAAARAAYVSVSEAETINQGIRPQPCTAEERATLRGKMQDVRAGRFEAL